jgi:lysyl-tRNA synthetase, class II
MESTHSGEVEVRVQRMKEMRELGLNPFAQGYDRTHDAASLVAEAGKRELRHLEEILENPKADISVAGRVTLHRSFGGILFATLQDGSGTFQVMFSKKLCNIVDKNGEAKEVLNETMSAFKYAEKMIDLGDFIGTKGELFYTKKGELTLFVTEFVPLTKAMRPLPEKWSGLTDEEALYRQRYLDLIANEDTYERFHVRAIQVPIQVPQGAS